MRTRLLISTLIGAAAVGGPAAGLGVTGTPAVCGGKPATIAGTADADRIAGTGGDDVIAAGGGDDFVRAGSGNDIVCGGRGNDELNGGPGRDTLRAGPGYSWCRGGERLSHCTAHRPLIRVRGRTQRAGPRHARRSYRYQVFVEAAVAENAAAAARFIDSTLGDRRGWTASGAISVRRVSHDPNTRIVIATPKTVDRLCYPLPTRGLVSCNQGRYVVLNILRWRQAFRGWTGSLPQYRRMLINHEDGHRYGLGHQPCRRPGARADVMQAQTFDLQGCRANWWPRRPELRRLSATIRGG